MNKNSVSKQPARSHLTPKTKPAEIIKVASDVDEVVCDGGLDSLGHPQVWYSFDGRSEVCCFYCGRTFVQEQGT